MIFICQEKCAPIKDKSTKSVGHCATEPAKNCPWVSLVTRIVLKVVAVQMGRSLMIVTSVYHINPVPVISTDKFTRLGLSSAQQAAVAGKYDKIVHAWPRSVF